MKLEIKRLTSTVALVEIDEGTVFSSELLGSDKIYSVFYSESVLDIRVDDYVMFNTRKFSVKNAVGMQQIDKRTYRYELNFYGEIYSLYDELITHLGRTKFSYSGTPLDLLNLIIDSLNSDSSGWSVGTCSGLGTVETFDFSEQSCRTALTDIAQRFELEYSVLNKKISLIPKIGFAHDVTLEYGRGKGLESATRQAVDKAFATVWYGFGGNQNLPSTYRNGMDRVTISETVERNVSLYGRKKGSVTFDDVYPKRTGTVGTIVNINTVIDTSIDFDLNAQIINDSAKIVFKSGELSGQEFVITNYNHTKKQITFGSNKDDTGYVLPNVTFSPAVGDKYTLIGIVMPQSYIDAAEAEVLRLTKLHARQNSYPPVAFPLDIDEKFIREMGLAYRFQAGDSVKVKSVELGIWAIMRLQSVSYPLVNPCKISGVVADSIQYSTQEMIVRDIKKAKKDVAAVQEVAALSKKQSDEIANAAIMSQFEKTYVGDQAVLSGAFIVGNPTSGQVGGLSGAGTELTDVVFFAGSSFTDRNIAPFRVQRNGKAFASDLEVKNGCKIGAFEVTDNVLVRKTNADSFAVNTNYATVGDYFLFRKNSSVRGNVKEISFNLNGAFTYNYAIKIENSITDTGGLDNIALYAKASSAATGAKNVAIRADGEVHITGKLRMNEQDGRSQTYSISGNTLTFVNGILV